MQTFMDFLEFVLFEIGDYQLTIFTLVNVCIIFLVARVALWLIRRILHRNFSQKTFGDSGRRHAVLQISKYIIYTFAVVMGMRSLGIDVSLLVGGSAALLVGIGLGLQNTFNDFISGIIILFEGSIEIDDIVEVDGLIGKVKRIGIRTTLIDTREAIGVVVPNSKFTSQNVINWESWL